MFPCFWEPLVFCPVTPVSGTCKINFHIPKRSETDGPSWVVLFVAKCKHRGKLGWCNTAGLTALFILDSIVPQRFTLSRWMKTDWNASLCVEVDHVEKARCDFTLPSASADHSVSDEINWNSAVVNSGTTKPLTWLDHNFNFSSPDVISKRTTPTWAAPRMTYHWVRLILKATLIRKTWKKRPVFEMATLFGWLVCSVLLTCVWTTHHLPRFIYSSFTGQCERKTRSFTVCKDTHIRWRLPKYVYSRLERAQPP